MSEGGWVFYVVVLAASMVLSLVLTPLAVKFALSRGILDHPHGHKSHDSPVPYLGGLAMVGAFSLAVLVAGLLRPPSTGLTELVAVLGLAMGLSVVGLVDDLAGLGAWPRIVCEIGAGVGLYAIGSGVVLFHSDIANLIVTVVWVVGIINALNLLDNMDGLSAGVAAIGGVSFLVIAAVHGQYLVAGLAAGTTGCAIGFLRHNFHPARIYMGDSGSLFLGFILAYLGMKLRFPGPTNVTFLVPILVLGVAILDTTLVTVCRLLNRQSPFQGGRDHVSHRLVAVGLPVRAAVGVLYATAAGLGVVALVVSRIDRTDAYVLAGVVVALGLVAAVFLARVPIYRESVVPLAADSSAPEVTGRARLRLVPDGGVPGAPVAAEASAEAAQGRTSTTSNSAIASSSSASEQ